MVVHTCSSLDNEHPASAVTYLSITKAGCSFFSHRSVAFSLPPGISVDCSSVAEGRRWWWDLIMIDIVWTGIIFPGKKTDFKKRRKSVYFVLNFKLIN